MRNIYIKKDGLFGLHNLSLDENISIFLPNEWALIRGEQMQIRNKNGNIIAVGKKVGLYSEDQLEDALRDYYGKEVISFKRVFELNGRYPYFGNGARVQIHLTKMRGDYETKQLFVYLPYEEGKYVFCFAFTEKAVCDEIERGVFAVIDGRGQAVIFNKFMCVFGKPLVISECGYYCEVLLYVVADNAALLVLLV